MSWLDKFLTPEILELARRVRTDRGADRFDVPIGSAITSDGTPLRAANRAIKNAETAKDKPDFTKQAEVRAEQIKRGDKIQSVDGVWSTVLYVKDRGSRFAYYDAQGKLIRMVAKGFATVVRH